MANDRHDRGPTDRGRAPAATATRAEIDAFLARVKGLAPTGEAGRRGRLIFALDATMSRQPLWDTACQLQADMFREAAAIRGAGRPTGYQPRLPQLPPYPLGVPGARPRPP